MGRRHVDDPGVVRKRLDDEALAVDGHSAHYGTVGLEEPVGCGVAGVLDGDDSPRLDKHAGDEVDGLLGADGHDDVLARAGDRPGQTEVTSDLLAQSPVSSTDVGQVVES
jgi:hypothetical protein